MQIDGRSEPGISISLGISGREKKEKKENTHTTYRTNWGGSRLINLGPS
jgi:hypothetical protein